MTRLRADKMSSIFGLLGSPSNPMNDSNTSTETNVVPLAAVLIEAALKLCSLSDLNVLIIVDDAAASGDVASKKQVRRCWAGRRHLRDEFVSGGVQLEETDIELDIDLSLSSIIPKPTNTEKTSHTSQTQHHQQQHQQHYQHPPAKKATNAGASSRSPSPASTSGLFPLRQPASLNLHHQPFSRKRPRPTLGPDPPFIASLPATNLHSPPKEPCLSSSTTAPTNDTATADVAPVLTSGEDLDGPESSNADDPMAMNLKKDTYTEEELLKEDPSSSDLTSSPIGKGEFHDQAGHY
jgi:hypothetical protein